MSLPSPCKLTAENVRVLVVDKIVYGSANDLVTFSPQQLTHGGIDVEFHGFVVDEPETLLRGLEQLFQNLNSGDIYSCRHSWTVRRSLTLPFPQLKATY